MAPTQAVAHVPGLRLKNDAIDEATEEKLFTSQLFRNMHHGHKKDFNGETGKLSPVMYAIRNLARDSGASPGPFPNPADYLLPLVEDTRH